MSAWKKEEEKMREEREREKDELRREKEEQEKDMSKLVNLLSGSYDGPVGSAGAGGAVINDIIEERREEIRLQMQQACPLAWQCLRYLACVPSVRTLVRSFLSCLSLHLTLLYSLFLSLLL